MTVVGKLPAERIGKTPEERTRLTALAVADALKRQTGADFGMNPSGGGFFEVFRERDVRRFDVWAVMPFKNNAVVAALTGAQVQELARRPDNITSGDITTIDPAKTYRVAMVDFIAGDAYKLSASVLTATGKDIREMFISDLGK